MAVSGADELVRWILANLTTIAVVGLSRHPAKDAHIVPAQMQAAGYRVIPVNPFADEILGERAHASLAELPEPVDMVQVFRPSREAPAIARQAVAIGARALWLQLGLASSEAAAIAREGGLLYVEDRCFAVDLARLGGFVRGRET